MPPFVELAIIRQMDFRDDAEQAAAMNRKRAIIEPALMAQRRADEDQRHEIGGSGDEAVHRARDGGMQRVLQQKVVDRIARQRKLGKHRERSGIGVQFRQNREDRLAVCDRVGEPAGRRASCDAREALAVYRTKIHQRHSSFTKAERPAQPTAANQIILTSQPLLFKQDRHHLNAPRRT